MIRTLAAAATLGALALFAGAASAQSPAPSWGQPVYVDGWGRPVGGTPLSEVETRAYVDTGRWADGYTDRPRVRVPYPGGWRSPRGYGDRYNSYGHGHRYRYGYHNDRRGWAGARPYQGYRDEWGYRDDRPRPGRQGYVGYRSRGYDRDCGCGDVYLYDR